MNIKSYTLNLHNHFLIHAPVLPWILRDDDADTDKSELEAQVRSGDYFETLATKLDAISLELSNAHASQNIVLQKLITELLYLQRHYDIRKKD